LKTVYRLAQGVQVRKEIWGLLLYSQADHKIHFIKSRNMLYPRHFNGTWTLDHIVREIAERLEIPGQSVEQSIKKVLDRLIEKEMIVNELC
jgi:putative mycofactocin binding protein MftB